ncbi:MAG: Sapep family Mn(2+)-dependent dipeptidase, partial [Anaerovorax sp.]
MMDYLKRIDEYKDDMVTMLQELIAIPSVESQAEPDAPFGRGVADAFLYMLKKGEDEGFHVENVDNYGGHIEFGGYTLDAHGAVVGTCEEAVGILGHLDVVPVGGNWDFPPFGGEISDGKVYGRGAADDKGPVVAAFYAMKGLKEAGFVPEKKVRLILGLDEETNWMGMDRYLAKVKAPEMAFTPDGDFPVIHGEMGIMIFELAKKLGKNQTKGLTLRTVTGGNAANMVADQARAVLRGPSYQAVKEALQAFRKETGYEIKEKGIGKSLELTVQGISAHGARPESG